MADLFSSGLVSDAGIGWRASRRLRLGLAVMVAATLMSGGVFSRVASAAVYRAFVANHGGTVTPIELASNKAGPAIPVGPGPAGVAITPNGETAYVTNQDGGTVTPIEVASNKVGPAIHIGEGPYAIAITPNGETAYVTNSFVGTVTPINVSTNKAGSPIPVGTEPEGVAITPNGATAYVTNYMSGTVTPINVATNTAGTPIPVGFGPLGLAITPNGETAYVVNSGSDTVTPINVATNTAGTPIPVGVYPQEVAIAPNGETAYVTNYYSDTVTPINVATNTVGPPIMIGEHPVGIAITPNGETAYVTDGADTVTPIDLTTSTAGTPITVGSQPVGIAITDAPEAEIESPVGDGVYARGQAVPTEFSCTEGEDGPGIASCDDNNGTAGITGTIKGKLDTSTLGEHAYSVTATSRDGGSDTVSIGYMVVKARCAANTGTITLSPGLTDTAAVQAIKINGTLTGCSGEPFEDAKYTAKLTTAHPVSCSALKTAGESATGNAKYTWMPKAKASTGTLDTLLTEIPGMVFSGTVTTGSYSPLTLSGTTTESFAGGATCGEKIGKRAPKPVKKGTFSGSAVSFD